jgi:hypothetical protein
MEASIERERFLAAQHIRSGRDSGNKDQVPTVGRSGTRDSDECMRSEQDVAKGKRRNNRRGPEQDTSCSKAKVGLKFLK